MAVEVVLADAVRYWSAAECPDDRRAAERAVAIALRSFASGASISEACEVARAFLASWAHHPASGGQARVQVA